jgi:hypothetical protein
MRASGKLDVQHNPAAGEPQRGDRMFGVEYAR